MIGIYKITAPDGKVYIGQTKNIAYRFGIYKSDNRVNRSHPRLYFSFDSFGIDNHIFEVIEECLSGSLNERERYWQDFYEVLGDNGLNCKLTSTSTKKGVLIESSRIAMVQKLTGRKMSPSHKSNVLAANARNKGVARDPGIIAKCIETRIKNNKKRPEVTTETRKKISAANKGKQKPDRSNEHLNNLAKAAQSRSEKGPDSYAYKMVLNLETGIYYFGGKEAAQAIGVSPSEMCLRLNGKREKCNKSYQYV